MRSSPGSLSHRRGAVRRSQKREDREWTAFHLQGTRHPPPQRPTHAVPWLTSPGFWASRSPPALKSQCGVQTCPLLPSPLPRRRHARPPGAPLRTRLCPEGRLAAAKRLPARLQPLGAPLRLVSPGSGNRLQNRAKAATRRSREARQASVRLAASGPGATDANL